MKQTKLVLQCDASEKGLGASLLQSGRPISYASRALTSTEQNFAQIEKELLAIVFGIECFHQYTFGRKVIVDSDHKPLETIFQKPLHSAPKRLQKMMMRLQRYDLQVQYKKGAEMHVADMLSRNYLPLQTTRASGIEDDKEEEEWEEVNQLLATPEKLQRYKSATDSDEALQELKTTIQLGWPESREDLPAVVSHYFHFRDELVVQDGVILKGDKVVVPKSLRKELLSELHQSHQGIESTLRRARELIYWPGMSSEIKDHIKSCVECSANARKQQKEPLVSHDVPDRPWAKVATDLLEYDKKDYLVTVDYFSSFFELDRLYSTSSKAGIQKLKAHFARYGIPDELMSDQGSNLVSEEFKAFEHEYGFRHIYSSPYHWESRGCCKVANHSGSYPYLVMLDMRNTPQEGLDSSPAQRLMNRRTRTRIPNSSDILKPAIVEGVVNKIQNRQT